MTKKKAARKKATRRKAATVRGNCTVCLAVCEAEKGKELRCSSHPI